MATRSRCTGRCAHTFQAACSHLSCIAELGTVFAPPPHVPAREETAAAPAAAPLSDASDDGEYSWDEATVVPRSPRPTPPSTPPASPQPPPSTRATREGAVLQGLADLEVSPRYPPYEFESPGEGSMSRSQGRAKTARPCSSSDPTTGLQPRNIF